VVEVRPMEPAGHYNLALALDRKGEYQRAFDILWNIVSGIEWEGDMNVDQQALVALNAIVSRSKGFTDSAPVVKVWKFKQPDAKTAAAPASSSGDKKDEADKKPAHPDPKPFKLVIPKEFNQNEFVSRVDLDLRIVLTWDTTSTDCDLHVIEPNGNRCYWRAKNSLMGGFYTVDVKNGLGPEEYALKSAQPGDYKIAAKYHRFFPSVQTGPTTLRIDVYTNFARMNQSLTSTLVRFKPGEWGDITRINVPMPPAKK